VHLEKIKHSKAAGRYLLKAVGYLAKGTDGNQGSVLVNAMVSAVTSCLNRPHNTDNAIQLDHYI